MLIALRPSAATLTLPALIALAGSIDLCGFLMIVTRFLRETSNTVLVTGQIAGTLLFGVVAAPFGWVTPPPLDFALLCLFGVIAIVALACVNRSLKLAPASVVVPYQYTMIVWAIVLGYIVFGDVPDAFTLVGAAIIVAAGLYILWREQARGVQPQVSRRRCREPLHDPPHVSPALERGPDAALEPEAVDGAEELSARMRQRPTPVHWKPHFSSTRREAGLVTRAPPAGRRGRDRRTHGRSARAPPRWRSRCPRTARRASSRAPGSAVAQRDAAGADHGAVRAA